MRRTLRSGLAGLLAAGLGANALAMLFASAWWYAAAPGVVATGLYNAHFVKDIGATYLVTAGALASFAWNPARAWPGLAAGAAFLVLHGAIHIADAIASPVCGRDLVRDFPGVFMPALIAAGLLASYFFQTEPQDA